MRLAVGEPAPSFSVTDLRGDRIALTSLQDKPVWLAFFRFASCPLCNLRVHEMLAQWPRFARRCHFVSVFQSPRERFEGFLAKHQPPFPVIADPELTLFTAYRVENSLKAALSFDVMSQSMKAARLGMPLGLGPKDGAALRVPADFVIGEDGRLTLAHYGATVADSVRFDVVAAHLGV